MKIRTDFVTNSSSSSYISARIESPVLADILRRLKAQLENPPLPDGPEKDRIRKDYHYTGLDRLLSVQEPGGPIVEIDTDGGGGPGAPREIKDLGPAVYDAISTYLDGDFSMFADYESVIEELESRSEEIAESTTMVDWDCGERNWGEFDDESISESFVFDRASGMSSFEESC